MIVRVWRVILGKWEVGGEGSGDLKGMGGAGFVNWGGFGAAV